MTDFEYCIDGKPAITMLTTVLTTVLTTAYYGLLRWTVPGTFDRRRITSQTRTCQSPSRVCIRTHCGHAFSMPAISGTRALSSRSRNLKHGGRNFQSTPYVTAPCSTATPAHVTAGRIITPPPSI